MEPILALPNWAVKHFYDITSTPCVYYTQSGISYATPVACQRVLKNIISAYHTNPVTVECGTGIGCDTVALSQCSRYVTSYEINKQHARIAAINISRCGSNANVVNKNFLDVEEYGDILYLDPPWGGSCYRTNTNLMYEAKNNSMSLADVVNNNINNFTTIICKTPCHYNERLLSNKFNICQIITINRRCNYNTTYAAFKFIVLSHRLHMVHIDNPVLSYLGYKKILSHMAN